MIGRLALFAWSALLASVLLAGLGAALMVVSIPLGVVYAWDWYRSGGR